MTALIRHYRRIAIRSLALALAASVLLLSAARAEDESRVAAELFGVPPQSVTLGPIDGEPPARVVESGGRRLGYLASTWQVAQTVGYSGKPIDVLIAIDREGRIVGARLVEQTEPILTIGVTERDIARYINGFVDLPLDANVEERKIRTPETIAGATVSSDVIRDGIIRAGRAVALSRGLLGQRDARRVVRSGYEEADWESLLAEGAVAHRRITLGEVADALGRSPIPGRKGNPQSLFIDLYAGLVTPPTIGQNLLGQQPYTAVVSEMGPDDHAILVAASGLYSFKGTGWRRNGHFDRIELRQDSRTIQLTEAFHRPLRKLAAPAAPKMRELGIFIVPASAGFDATRPWRLSLVVRPLGQRGGPDVAHFEVTYRLPQRFILEPPEPQAATDEPPLWQRNWLERIPGIAIVALQLAVLAGILVFQDALVRHYRLYRATRIGFLLFTLVVLGWVLGAQLSIIHVLTFIQALRTGFHWETFLLDPLVFILWGFVAVALLFWGRGVFCGWLCPFGALQELLSELARKLKLPQLSIPFGVHERLWPFKYAIFLGLFGLSLNSIALTFNLAEIEPFKTAITLRFARSLPYVGFAVGILAAGLFVERFYCRYICPLGAALAIPARLRMFDWLKRRRECGPECQLCAWRCTVQAIHPDGSINPNECIHCLHCQTLYFDETRCPPLVKIHKQLRKRQIKGIRP